MKVLFLASWDYALSGVLALNPAVRAVLVTVLSVLVRAQGFGVKQLFVEPRIGSILRAMIRDLRQYEFRPFGTWGARNSNARTTRVRISVVRVQVFGEKPLSGSILGARIREQLRYKPSSTLPSNYDPRGFMEPIVSLVPEFGGLHVCLPSSNPRKVNSRSLAQKRTKEASSLVRKVSQGSSAS